MFYNLRYIDDMYVVKSCELNQCCTMLDIKMNISTLISLDSVKTLLIYP